MNGNPLKSLAEYSRFIAELMDRDSVKWSTLRVWSQSPYTGTAEGEALFTNGIRLRLREELDFEAGLITGYGYEVYKGKERLCWFDDFPHPDDISLKKTYPHHKHVHPDIKHNRIPAPGISYDQPNLPLLIGRIEEKTIIGK